MITNLMGLRQPARHGRELEEIVAVENSSKAKFSDCSILASPAACFYAFRFPGIAVWAIGSRYLLFAILQRDPSIASFWSYGAPSLARCAIFCASTR